MDIQQQQQLNRIEQSLAQLWSTLHQRLDHIEQLITAITRPESDSYTTDAEPDGDDDYEGYTYK